MTARTSRAQHGAAVGLMALGLMSTLAAGVRQQGLAIDSGDLSVVAAVMAFVALLAWCVFRFGHVALAAAALSSMALFAIILLALLETALLATHARPYADPMFAAADAVVAPWLDWPALAAWFARHRAVAQGCEWIYHSIAWQPFVLIALLCGTGRHHESWRFIGMWTLALLICETVFALYPGVGAYVFHHVDPALTSPTSEAVASGQLRLLTRLRDPAIHMIDNRCIGGMITFPSFHAVAATLLARGYWRIPAARWPFALLNLAMLGTAVPMGGHYIVDLIAGLGVAGLAIAAFDAPPLRWHGMVPRRGAGGRLARAPEGFIPR